MVDTHTVQLNSVKHIWLFNRMLFYKDYAMKNGQPVLVAKILPNIPNRDKFHMLQVTADKIKTAFPYLLDTSKILQLQSGQLLTLLKTAFYFYFEMFHILKSYYNVFSRLVDSKNIAPLYYFLQTHYMENSNLYCLIL